jgi:molecular chaperone GrpE
MRVEDAGQPDGLIVEELQKGYEIGGKVLRPSMVKVVGNS